MECQTHIYKYLDGQEAGPACLACLMFFNCCCAHWLLAGIFRRHLALVLLVIMDMKVLLSFVLYKYVARLDQTLFS